MRAVVIGIVSVVGSIALGAWLEGLGFSNASWLFVWVLCGIMIALNSIGAKRLRAYGARSVMGSMLVVFIVCGALGVLGWRVYLGRPRAAATPAAKQLPKEAEEIRVAFTEFVSVLDEWSGRDAATPKGSSAEIAPTSLEVAITSKVEVAEPLSRLFTAVKRIENSPLYLPSIPGLPRPRASYSVVHQRFRSARTSPWIRVSGASDKMFAYGVVSITDRRPIDNLLAALDSAERAILPGGESEKRSILRYQLSQFLFEGGMEQQTLTMLLQPSVKESGGMVNPMDQLGKTVLRIQDWHVRLISFVQIELGDVYVARLMTHTSAKPYPKGMHAFFESSWDNLTHCIAKIEEFLKELPEIPEMPASSG
jgi:hypothetical protein